jgi:hypothetical protein
VPRDGFFEDVDSIGKDYPYRAPGEQRVVYRIRPRKIGING